MYKYDFGRLVSMNNMINLINKINVINLILQFSKFLFRILHLCEILKLWVCVTFFI